MYWEFISFIFCYLMYISVFVRSCTVGFFWTEEEYIKNTLFFVFFSVSVADKRAT